MAAEIIEPSNLCDGSQPEAGAKYWASASQRLRSLEFPSSTPYSCRSTISLSIALCKSHAKAMSGG